MFSLPIFKQTVRANYTFWLIFTFILAALLSMFSAVHDPAASEAIMEALEGTSLGEMAGAQFAGMTSLLGVLSQAFYGMLAVVLPMVYIIITANSLVASEVDRGSMGYTLSTPTKRVSVVFTKAVFLIGSLLLMFTVITLAGLFTVQAVHGGVWGENYTADVEAAAAALNRSEADVAADLSLILNNAAALAAGARAHSIDEEIYTAYLEMARQQAAYQAAADVLGVDIREVENDLTLISANEEAQSAAAAAMGMEQEAYSAYLSQTISQEAMAAGMRGELQMNLLSGLTAAAELLEMDVADLSTDMGMLKDNEAALDAAVEASGIQRPIFMMMINQSLVSQEMNKDADLEFSVENFVMLNVGCFLLMLAISGISYLASCAFNLTKYSMAVGAGIPLAFFVFNIISEISGSLEAFKYLTLNSLFDAKGIANGDYSLAPLVALAALGVALYTLSIYVFKTKDLPL